MVASEKLPSSPLQPHAHQESNVKIYVQGAKSTLARNDADGSDSDWYPAVEQYKSHVDYDYEQESKNAEKGSIKTKLLCWCKLSIEICL